MRVADHYPTWLMLILDYIEESQVKGLWNADLGCFYDQPLLTRTATVESFFCPSQVHQGTTVARPPDNVHGHPANGPEGGAGWEGAIADYRAVSGSTCSQQGVGCNGTVVTLTNGSYDGCTGQAVDGPIPQALREAVENPLGMPPLKELVGRDSRVLIAFDDNCQPFPPMQRPDIRQIMITRLLELLEDYGVRREDVQLRCAVALHRKMRRHEMEHMLGEKLMEEFWPERLRNFDAEDPEDIVSLGETDHGEPVQTSRAVTGCDLVIYVDTIQIPLNGGHKSVAVGFGTYESIAPHHSPGMTEHSPHVMQPEGSRMHDSIRRISEVVPSTSGPWWAARPITSSSVHSSTRTTTSSSTRSSARWVVSSSTSALTCAVRARTSSSSSLSSYVAASVPSSSE